LLLVRLEGVFALGLYNKFYLNSIKILEVSILLSKMPILVDKISKENVNKQALRIAIIAELDAVNLYEQLAEMVSDERIKKVLLDIAKEEKTHVGEFLALLLLLDKEQKEELVKGEEEVKEILEG